MMKDVNVLRVPDVRQFYIKKHTDDNCNKLFAKVTEHILMTGSVASMEEFMREISNRFKLRKAIVDENVTYNGCSIRKRKNGYTIIHMNLYLVSHNFLPLSDEQRMFHNSTATKNERRDFAKLADAFMWLGTAMLPQASFVASIMQKKLHSLVVQDIIHRLLPLETTRNTENIVSEAGHNKM